MYGRMLMVVLALGVMFAWQHQLEIKRWWRAQMAPAVTGAAPASTGVLVYTVAGCDSCESAAQLIEKSGVAVTRRLVDQDAEAQAEFESVGGGLPLIIDGQRQFSGYSEEFLAGWYLERPRNRALFTQAGIYREGEARLPILYGTTWCGYCAAARRYFADNGIAYRDLDIEHDAEAKRQYDVIGLQGVPVIVYEDMVWNGFDAGTMDAKRKWVSAN